MIMAFADNPSDENGGSAQYKKVIDLGQLTLKVVILINGVAAVSILTLISSHLSSDDGLNTIPPLLACTLASFGFGVLSGAIAVGMGYLSELHSFQGSFYNTLSGPQDRDFIEKKRLDEACLMYLDFARRLIYGSYALFGIGVVLCTVAFLC